MKIELEKKRILYEKFYKNSNPFSYINSIDEIKQFLNLINENKESEAQNLWPHLYKCYQKAIQYIQSKTCQSSTQPNLSSSPTNTISLTSLFDNPMHNSQKKGSNRLSKKSFQLSSAKSTKDFLQDFDSNLSIKYYNISKTGSIVLALSLGEIEYQDNNFECKICAENTVLKFTEKPQPRYVCPNCGYFVSIGDIQLEGSFERDSVDHTGYGVVGTKLVVSDSIIKFFDYDVNYIEKLDPELLENIYIVLHENKKTNIETLKWQELEEIIDKIYQKSKDKKYYELLQNSYNIYCSLRGEPIIKFSEDEKIIISKKFDLFIQYWKELKPNDRIRSILSWISWGFTLLACGYKQEVVCLFFPNKKIDYFESDNLLFIEISHKMNLNPPITLLNLCPDLISTKPVNSLFTDFSKPISKPLNNNINSLIPKNIKATEIPIKTNQQSKIIQRKKTVSMILD